MTYSRKHFRPVCFFTLFAMGVSTPVFGQDIGLNYESLSSLEEPIATELGDFTVQLTGLADLPVIFDLQDDFDTTPGFVGNFQVSAETQLSNRWRVGVAYFGQYATFEGLGDEYSDNVAGFIGGAWGTVAVGNVSGLVNEETRRIRGAGNAALAFDGVMGVMEDISVGYVGRFGPTILSGVIDEEANFELGLSYQRPLGNKDYRFAARYTNSEYALVPNVVEYEAQGVTGVAEFIYGSSLFDLGVGYEMFDSPTLQDVERWYLSSGARWKGGALSLSAEAHYGEVEGSVERSYALGAQYDIARGLSLNLGLNHADSQAFIGGISFANIDDTSLITSLRYSF